MIQCFPVTKMQEHLFLNPKKCEQYIADCLVIIFCCSKRRSSDCGLNWVCTLQKPWSPWQLHRARPFSKKYLFWVCLVEMWQKWEDSLKRKMKMNVSTLNLFYFIFNLALSWHWLATLLTSQVICKTGTHTTWSNTHTHSSPASRVWNLHLSVTALSVHSTTSHGNLTWPNCVKSILTQPLFFFPRWLHWFMCSPWVHPSCLSTDESWLCTPNTASRCWGWVTPPTGFLVTLKSAILMNPCY